MGKSIISQARGRGGPTYRVRKKAFQYKIGYPMQEGQATIIDLLHSAGHSAPLLKLSINNENFFNPAFNGAYIGQNIVIGRNSEIGNILMLKNVPAGTKVYNIENNPGDGGKMIRTAGSSATVTKKHSNNKVSILMPNKKELVISGDCRVTIGEIAGAGRKLKPFIKAGRKFHKMRAKGGKLWHRTSAVKVNAVDHPFGSGRGKRIKSKIAKRNAPAGARVGHIRPRQTGWRK